MKQKVSEEEQDKGWRDMLYFGFVELPSTLFKPYLLGLLLSSALIQWLEPGELVNWVGSGWTESLALLAFSIPLYLCATSSLPLGVAFVTSGVSLGGIAIFLMAGPVTNLVSLMMISKMMGRKITAIYLGVIVLGSILLSFMINAILGQA